MNDFAPDFAAARVRVSPNFGQRAGGVRPSMIVLHYTGMVSGQAAEDWLCNLDSQVSSHYLVHVDGAVVQFVPEAERAWHAGKSFWRGLSDINSASIGVEIVNPGHEFGYVDFPRNQMDAVIELCRSITARHAIAPEMLLGHSDVAPGRKVDPGERFNWRMLSKAGLGHYVAPSPIRDGSAKAPISTTGDVLRLQSMLQQYGYGLEATGQYDARTQTVVAAFQQHFRQRRVDGVADHSTLRTLERLIKALPAAPGVS
jgi:N-acetylmuramoyl-L-alanine amidase